MLIGIPQKNYFMKTAYQFQINNCTLYPGEYKPSLNTEELMSELKKTHEGSTLQPFINVSECNNYFKVVAAIPGVKKEDFFIHIDYNTLSISALHKNVHIVESEKFQLHEFNYECFNRNIILPENVERDFVKAEYNDGILSIYLPKSDSPVVQEHTDVIVY